MEDIQEFQDKHLICKDCGAEFIFTAGEQQYFKDRFLAEPKRCPNCRASRRRPNFQHLNDGEGVVNE